MNQNTFWTERYCAVGEDYLFGLAPNRFLERHADIFHDGETALCVADGEGRNSVWLAEQRLKVTAVEITEIAVIKAKKLVADRNVTVNLEIGDMLAPDWPPIPYQNAFDWVIGIFIQFTNPEERLRQMMSMKLVTKPGGRILLQGYTPQQLNYRTGGPSAVDNLYTSKILNELFSDWDVEELTEYEDNITEGLGHSGHSALIGMIARKPAI